MKFTTTLALAATGSAFVLPEPRVFEQLELENPQKPAEPSLWDKAPSVDALFADAKNIFEHLVTDAKDAAHTVGDKLSDFFADEFDNEDHPRHPHHPHQPTDKTIYQLISESKYTTKFAKIVSEYEDIVNLLNSTDAGNHTLFAPVDSAFEHIPDDKKPSKEFVEKVLQYHIADGSFSARRLLSTQTVPTVLKEKLLGDKQQRLRTSVGFGGLRINYFTKVVGGNVQATNGFVHGVNHILIPPPFVGRELTLLPSYFSTLLLAYEKTDFTNFIHNVPQIGATLFAPSNNAWAKLGPRANAFLFNSERGLKYLEALLKYQMVVNTTLYTDAIYEAKTTTERYHVDLPTLLGETHISVDIATWGLFTKATINGYVPVVARDNVAKNGVIQVVGRVPFPPHKPHNPSADSMFDGEVEVDDIIARLAPYVEPKENEPGEL
jgi:uncharacterized surface protein with fasciclin (FAS1) repeats